MRASSKKRSWSSVATANVVLGIATAIALAFYLAGHRVQRLHDDTCSVLTAIASDSQKMQYVKGWVASRTNDETFMDEVRQNRYFEQGDPRLREFIDLNWNYLGFVPQDASLVFNVKDPEQRDFEAAAIESVSLRQGRSTIIIKLSSAGDLGLMWPAEALQKIKAVRADIFTHCEYSN